MATNKSKSDKIKSCSLISCPKGKHSVRTHSERIPPSKKHPQGHTIIRHEHCARNPSYKKVLSFDEIRAISEKSFSNLSGSPALATGLLAEFDDANKYDVLIRGWVHYWNEIFQPKDPLDPNLVKALMATESGFKHKAKNTDYSDKKRHAYGLLQVTAETAGILKNHKGELKDYLIDAKLNDLYDPSINICCGVRWLFQKKKLASIKLGKEADWEYTIIDYKGYRDEVNSGKVPGALKRMRKYYADLRGKK
ncbi:MAG TPA: transglycosylase SLT domain-containing protein [Candidatus Babeliales bacterium]|nr:transglycosylase SLT domain-containing protein [Candidatus Babeliales bacterium]